MSKHILAKGGQALQDKCNKYVSINGNVKVGDIAVTGPGKISCKHIIHTVGAEYEFLDSSKSEKVQVTLTVSCMVTNEYNRGYINFCAK